MLCVAIIWQLVENKFVTRFFHSARVRCQRLRFKPRSYFPALNLTHLPSAVAAYFPHLLASFPMPIKDFAQLQAEINAVVRLPEAGGTPVKTTAAGLNALLQSLAREITSSQPAAGPLAEAKAVRFSTDEARTQTYYATVGTEAAGNEDDGVVLALREAQPGETVRVLAPLVFPYAPFYPPVLSMAAGITFDLAGFGLKTDPEKNHDGIGLNETGDYTIYGGHATLECAGPGSSCLTWAADVVPDIRAYDVHIVNSGTANGVLMRSGTLFHRGSLRVQSETSEVVGVGLADQEASYELLGDVTLANGCYGFDIYSDCRALVRQGRYSFLDESACLAQLHPAARLELQQYVVDLSLGPTTNGVHFLGSDATLVLTDVTVLGGSLRRESSLEGTVVLRGRTVLPAEYGVDYLREQGLTVVDERGFPFLDKEG